MATVTGLTADRMLAIEAASIVDGTVDSSGNLILSKHDGATINAGNVIGPPIAVRIPAKSSTSIPSEYPTGLSIFQFSSGEGWPTTYGTVTTVIESEFRGFQLVTQKSTGSMWVRTVGDDDWSTFLKFSMDGHTHAWGEITGKPATFAPATHSHAWNDITSKPTTFAPSTHSHAWNDITSKPTTFAPSTHSHDWNSITSKPSNFTPSAHSHTANDVGASTGNQYWQSTNGYAGCFGGATGGSAWVVPLRSAIDGALTGLRLSTAGNETYLHTSHMYNQTNTVAANIYLSSGGWFYRTTSTARSKLCVEEYPESNDDTLLSLKARTWFDRGEAEDFARYIEAINDGDTDAEIMNREPLRRIPGMVAEEVEAAGLTEFVQYGSDGQVEGLMYERLGVALIPVVARQRDRINQLENRIARLETLLFDEPTA